MCKVKKMRVNEKAVDLDTWLAPYCGHTAFVIEHEDGEITVILDDEIYPEMEFYLPCFEPIE